VMATDEETLAEVVVPEDGFMTEDDEGPVADAVPVDDATGNESTESSVCEICGGTPCEWDQYADGIVMQSVALFHRDRHGGKEVIIDEQGGIVNNSKMRKYLYKAFTYLKYGHLGRGNRIPVPPCVVRKIRDMFPDPEDNYVGFHADYADQTQQSSEDI
jgi:hypothetical protein